VTIFYSTPEYQNKSISKQIASNKKHKIRSSSTEVDCCPYWMVNQMVWS